jgi:hypothetical protein
MDAPTTTMVIVTFPYADRAYTVSLWSWASLIAADLAWVWGRADLSPHSCLVKYIWNTITLPRSLPIVAQGRAEGTSEISLLGSASPSKSKSELVPTQRLSGGCFSQAPSHLGSVECFPLHTCMFCTSFHERSKKTEAIDAGAQTLLWIKRAIVF